MKDKIDKYYIGNCLVCKRGTALKNGYCNKCNPENNKMPEFLDELFGGKFK